MGNLRILSTRGWRRLFSGIGEIHGDFPAEASSNIIQSSYVGLNNLYSFVEGGCLNVAWRSNRHRWREVNTPFDENSLSPPPGVMSIILMAYFPEGSLWQAV